MKAYEKAQKLLKKGKTIIVFLEGEISRTDGKPGKPKTGAVRLALTGNVPVIPVGVAVRKKNIKYLYSKIKGEKELGTWYFWGPYAITVGKAMHLSGKAEDRGRVRVLSGKVMKEVTALARESDKRVN